ncbi:MAG: hypothetical protein WCJ59_00175 [bacterium]
MNKTKKVVLTLGSVLSVLTLAVVFSNTALAYKGNPAVKGPNYSADRHIAMTKAFESNDYEAWKKLMANNSGRVTDLITKDNFAKFAEAHRLALKGDMPGSQKIKQELGLGKKDGSGNKNHGNQGGMRGNGKCLNK